MGQCTITRIAVRVQLCRTLSHMQQPASAQCPALIIRTPYKWLGRPSSYSGVDSLSTLEAGCGHRLTNASNMLGFALSTALAFLACISGSLGSGITTFTDEQCKKSHEPLNVKNGYPDGLCMPLKITGNLDAFQIVQLDPGCAGTSL